MALYAAATKLDDVVGSYPPNDTGSSGLAVMKAAKKKGWIGTYSHAFGLDHVLRSLVLRPGITGISWLSGCDVPDREGIVKWSGSVRGGHELELVGLVKERALVWFCNSWGTGWGRKGYFAMSFEDYERALHEQGDATFCEEASPS